MARFRRVRWIAMTMLAVVAAATFAAGADAYADQGRGPCRSGMRTVAVQTGGHSWRTGGLRSAGCRAWRHIHHHRLYARTR
jgi:hypothetical protein